MNFKQMVIIVGAVLLFVGWQQNQLALGADSEPQAVELSRLERGSQSVLNDHVAVGEHYGLYPYCIFVYEEGFLSGEPDNDTKVDWVYYPIVSRSHSFKSRVGAANKAVKSGNAARLPRLGEFQILVKTSRFQTVGDIPMKVGKESSLQGLVVNDIQSLGDDEKKLLMEGMKGVDLDRVLILHDGRRPPNRLLALSLLGSGLLMFVGGFFLPGSIFEGAAE